MREKSYLVNSFLLYSILLPISFEEQRTSLKVGSTITGGLLG